MRTNVTQLGPTQRCGNAPRGGGLPRPSRLEPTGPDDSAGGTHRPRWLLRRNPPAPMTWYAEPATAVLFERRGW